MLALLMLGAEKP